MDAIYTHYGLLDGVAATLSAEACVAGEALQDLGALGHAGASLCHLLDFYGGAADLIELGVTGFDQSWARLSKMARW